MKLSKLSKDGVKEFIDFIDNINTIEDVERRRQQILNDHSLLVDDIECKPISSSPQSKLEVTQYLFNLLEQSSVSAETDKELWSWLSLYYFDTIHKKNKNNEYTLGEINKWIPNFEDYRKYYRHLLLGPWNIYKQHKGDIDTISGILCGEIHTPGDVYEQLASRQEWITSSQIQKAVTKLYYDHNNMSLKKGSGGKGGGSARRLSDVLKQFNMNYDFYAIKSDDLINLLPKEFDRFKSAY